MSLNPQKNKLAEARRRLPELVKRAERALATLVIRRRDRLMAETKLFQSLGYKSVLTRGYAVVRDKNGKALPLAADLKPGQAIHIEFADGAIDATTAKAPGQGSLF